MISKSRECYFKGYNIVQDKYNLFSSRIKVIRILRRKIPEM